MTIAEISVFKLLGTPTYIRPFIYKYLFTFFTVAPYWITTFGAPDESETEKIQINEVTRDYTVRYSRQTSQAAAELNEGSFYFDSGNQILYVHIEHDQAPWTAVMGYGEASGYSNKLVYIDDIFYNPLIKSIPSFAQQQELINYKKLSLINGSITLNNVGGILDKFKTTKIYNNTIDIYYLDDEIENPSRTDLQQQGQFLVDDYDLSLKEMIIRIKDKRTEGDADIPTLEFTVDDYPDIDEDYLGEIIPVLYGAVRISEAIPTDTNDTGTISFRQSIILTTLGTVQVLIDDVWTTKATTATDLSTGSFTLAQADGRKDGAAAGEPYECRVIDSIGPLVTYASDIIKFLNLAYLGIAYNSTNYDTTEWEAEETSLETIGILYNSQIKLSEAIRRVQDGANLGFRYEINAEGLRTIRVNNYERATAYNIHYDKIKNNNVLSVTTDKEYLAATLKVKYAQDYYSGKFRSIKNTDYAEYVLQTYRTQNIVIIEKLLTTETHASDFADWYLAKFSDVPEIVQLELEGSDYFNVRIYDIINVDLSAGPLEIAEDIPERPFYGRQKGIVLSIDPNLDIFVNNITLLLIEELEIYPTIRITEDGKIRITPDNKIRVISGSA